MIISWRGRVIGFGRKRTRFADSIVTIAAAKDILMADGFSEEAANRWLKGGVEVALGMGEHNE